MERPPEEMIAGVWLMNPMSSIDDCKYPFPGSKLACNRGPVSPDRLEIHGHPRRIQPLSWRD
jgi:hypothetical protein